MGNHENHDHGNDHDLTEGNRQYYSKGWYLPLLGLAAIALGFALLGGFVLNHSGTDKWGKKTECATECKEGEKCKDGEKCKEGEKCDGKCKEHEHGDMKKEENKEEAAAADTAKKEEVKPAEAPANGEHK
jgi:hypothetical protein